MTRSCLILNLIVVVFSSLALPSMSGSHAEARDSARSAPIRPGAVMYGVVPPLFGTKEPLRSVTARLDDLQKQGIDILWLSPINATDDIGILNYSVTDYVSIRPDFGTMNDLRALVRGAHQRGMKVILDIIPNHTSAAHPYHLDIQKKGRESRYYDFYDRDRNGEITHYFDWDNLLNLNFRNPKVTSMMNRVFRFWIDEAGIDGYRVDVAWGVREREPRFWKRLIASMRAEKPELIMLAEAGARDPYYIESGFDLAYDWTEKLGEWSWRDAFEQRRATGRYLRRALETEPIDSGRTAAGHVVARQAAANHTVRFLNNNDTGPRFVSRYGVALTRVAATLQHTVLGVPLVYTGDEVGAEYEPYEDPAPISWKDRHGLRGLYRRLAELRERLPALHSGSFIPLQAKGSPSTFAYMRVAGPRDWALVLLNFDKTDELIMQIPDEFRVQLNEASVVEAVSGTRTRLPRLTERGELKLRIPAAKAFVMVPSVSL